MAKKRPDFSFPELESRGRNAILRSTAEVRAEEQLLIAAGQEVPPTAETHPTPPQPTASPARARMRAPRATSVSIIERLRQKLTTKHHLASYSFRFQAAELAQLDQLLAELNKSRTAKLSKNDLVRLALNWLLADHEEHGQTSLAVEVTRQE